MIPGSLTRLRGSYEYVLEAGPDFFTGFHFEARSLDDLAYECCRIRNSRSTITRSVLPICAVL